MSGDNPKPDNADPTMDEIAKVRGRKRQAVADVAFDRWLDRGLHALYDEIAKEPIPLELLALIEKEPGDA